MNDLRIDPAFEKNKITSFIKTTLKEQGFKKVVLGMSGGIDSATTFRLLKEAIEPANILIAHLYYFESKLEDFKSSLQKANIPNENIYELPIKNAVGELRKTLNIPEEDRLRLGNVMARIRMIILYDLAKKNDALVLGTEDKSEFYLGYFTRFGDEASDIEPIRHLYKTQVYQLAKYLGVPKEIVNRKSSPDLWPGHTAEKELGFSYEEADIVLYLYFEQENNLSEIISKGFPNAKKIIDWTCKNSFKHHLPYVIK
ncbi:MAG: NH(3)-dependent NAD(+) synthetase [Candidatus Levybacteria bacterium GW2011_GWA2_37_36]|nr:MAG: NH(3)-dependent NAD(+) synthetase [Candidatus Levybacteria bacterium GW2011_GWA1_37_16]KKQ31578.1 MAG: NH(3)-dependent NAD(+) synthetase [Candidatus Levybacteria bacterium GW2011_GWA2_37_36]KKQ41202.1 MAG: NH(3)-dependent NAD(+) synthetase [Candidatus Levybacteria bacterium GW2011_GWB1_37_8]OGH51150.1 MAG: NAD(+) synthase [Candidatus Levybacteria bacterium RIFCSPLOWO2_12_FULL_37_14]